VLRGSKVSWVHDISSQSFLWGGFVHITNVPWRMNAVAMDEIMSGGGEVTVHRLDVQAAVGPQ